MSTCLANKQIDLKRGGGCTELDSPTSTEKDVGRLDISMDLSLRMQVVESVQQFSTDDGDVGLGKDAGF
jgi:hypothetical protein